MADKMPWEEDWGAPQKTSDKMPWEVDWSQEKPKGREGEAFAHGASNAVTLGYMPQLVAAASVPAVKLANLYDKYIDGYEGPQAEPSYTKIRDDYIAERDQLAKENPLSYGAGAVTGTVAGSLVAPGAGLLKGASLAQKAKGAAALGGIYGGLANPGDVQGEISPLQLKDRGINATVGAGVGAGVAGAGHMIGKGVNSLAAKSKDFAEKRAFDALGGTKGDVVSATEKGILNKTGRQLLDEDIVRFGSGKQAIADRLEQSVADKSGALKKAISEVQTGAGLSPEQMAQVNASKFNPKQAGDALKEEIRKQFSALPPEVVDSRLAQVDKFLSRNQPMDIAEAQTMKQQISKFIKDPTYWKDASNPSQETLAGVRRMIKEGIEKNADAYAGAAGQQGGKIKGINQALGNALEAQGVVDDRMARDLANRSFSLTDYLAGSAGAQASGPMGIAAAAANKVARERGSAAMAVGADKFSNMLMQSPRFSELAARNPQAFGAMATALRRKSPASENVPPEEVKDRFLSGN